MRYLLCGLAILVLALTPGFAAAYPRAFLADGQIWIQASSSQVAFQATHDAGIESSPSVSPNGKVILYNVRQSSGSGLLSPLNVVLLDWEGKELRRFGEVPMEELGTVCGYGSTEWIDDLHVGVYCEYNPSASDYLVLNSVTGKVEKEYPGLFFSWSPGHRTLAYVGFIVHFATPANQNNCVFFNEKTVYTPGCSSDVTATWEKNLGRQADPRQVADIGVNQPSMHGKPGTVTTARKAGAPIRRAGVREEPSHYENIHEIFSSLVWSLNGRNLAFVERIYDFDWGMDEKGEETHESKNDRYFLAVVSAGRLAVGYRLPEPIDQTNLEWLSASRVRLTGNSQDKKIDRTFDLAANPPRPIP